MSEATQSQFDPFLFITASILVPLIIALTANILGPYASEYWRLRNERQKTKWNQMHERFFAMLTNVPGFFVMGSDAEKQTRFLEAYSHVFLYAPDDTIRRFNAALMSMGYAKPQDTEADKAMKEAILSMRRTLYGKADLTRDDVLSPVRAAQKPTNAS